MKKIFLFLIGLMLCTAALIPNTLSAQSCVLQTKDTTLVPSGPGGPGDGPAHHPDPGPAQPSPSWIAPLGAYQITNITIAGDGGDAGKGEADYKGGDGGDGALIVDDNVYTLSSSSLRSLQYKYKEGDKDKDGRTVIFNSITYTAGNGANGKNATKPKPGQGDIGADGESGADGKCTLDPTPLDGVITTDGGAGNGAIGKVGGQDGPGHPNDPDKGDLGYVKLTYSILEIPVEIHKAGGVVRNTSILYYDQIGHVLIAADSANGENYFYDEECTRPVVSTDSCVADCDSTVILYSSPSAIYHIFSVAAGINDTVGRAGLKAAVDALNETAHGGTILTREAYSEVLNEPVEVSKDIKILALGGNATFTRGESLISNPMIKIADSVVLSIDVAEEVDTLVFDGGNMEVNKPIVLNDGTLNLLGNVVFRNNNSSKKGGAIVNNDSIYVEGNVLFQNNHTGVNGAGIYNDGGDGSVGALFIKGQVRFTGNKADGKGGAIYVQNGRMTVDSEASLVFENNESKLGTVFSGKNAEILIQGKTEFHNNIAENGTSIYVNSGTVLVNGYTVIMGDTATQGAIIYNKSNLYFNTGLVTGNVCQNNVDSIINGIISANGSKTYLRGGHIFNNKFDMTSELDYNPYTAVLTSKNAQLSLGDSISIDTVRLYLKDGYSQKINILSDLTAATASNPIVLVLDSLDKKVLRAEDGTTLAGNYVKFKPSSDTLAINNKGYAVRKPEISIDTVYLLQAGTDYADYGITTATGTVANDAIYVVYTQNVDAHGKSDHAKADSLKFDLSVAYNGGNPVSLNKKINNTSNGSSFVEFTFPETLSDGVLQTGSYDITANADVYTLGLVASDEYTQTSGIYVPTFTIDTLDFLLAGMKFSDFGHCGVGASTNDGAGDDIIPSDEIYVGYTRAENGNVDSAYIEVTLTDYNTIYTYKEGTVAGQILTPGCGHFRQFTYSDKWTPALNLSDAFDGKDFTYNINLYQRTEGEPYFAKGTKSGTYHHEIDRECTIALENTEACNAMGIQFSVNAANDTVTLTYPNYFDKNAVPQAMKRDGVIKVGISFDPQDPTITKAWFDDATDITTTDGKYIVWIPISKAISSSNPIVEAENYASTDDTIRLSSTDIKGVYRKTFVVEGTLTPVEIATANVTYHTTGASGVKFASDGDSLFKLYFDANDYTVWNVQNPVSFGMNNTNVYAGLYVNRPNNNVNAVYSTFNGFDADTVKLLADDLIHQLTDTAYIQYVELGTCGDQATKDYTFITKPSTASADFTSINGRLDTVYWFAGNEFVKAECYSVNYYYAPIYSVNFNFNGGGATCNVPYSDTFADTTYVFGRPIVRPDDPFKCGHLFMDWRHGVDSFTVDSFKNIRAGIAEGTVATTKVDSFGIRSNMVIDAAWKYFVTIANPNDTAVVAHYSLCEINTRDYVTEPTEAKRPYIYTFHKDYLGKYYRDYIPGKNGNCDVKFGDSVYLESPEVLPVGQTSQVTWTVTDMCGTPFTLTQYVNVMFPPCGADNYDPAESAYVAATNNHGSPDGEYLASIDGKDDYRTVRIGCNCWLKENLQNENYANGSSIPVAKAYFDDETKVPEFGRLYTWYSAVNVPEGNDNQQPETANETITFTQTSNSYSRDYVQGVCPDGWHIPALAEYQNLKDVVGTANAVKAVDGSYWLGFQDATDAAGFTGVPAGYYDNSTDRYFNILGNAYFWSTENYGVKALPCSLLYGCPEILFNEQNKYYGVSVRCVRNIKISY